MIHHGLGYLADHDNSQIGYTAIVLLLQVLIADVTSLQSRLLFSYIPSTPFIVSDTDTVFICLY